ncbi:unnamed protein product [Tuber melanosporum]|uniref:(Perigord truffle) hypothetical protein n=1 Tax=Tuber melanosporum (strain Mel28) TaxID=656061 RepID=D5G535_TUBMM|nr:uncharacterized protein GSTUM_00000301001 [Tuber melanosporum]CAZ79666.1 unnamed protein product [Tuber melanosporum]
MLPLKGKRKRKERAICHSVPVLCEWSGVGRSTSRVREVVGVSWGVLRSLAELTMSHDMMRETLELEVTNERESPIDWVSSVFCGRDISVICVGAPSRRKGKKGKRKKHTARRGTYTRVGYCSMVEPYTR